MRRARLVPRLIVGGFAAGALALALMTADRIVPPALQRAEMQSVVVADAQGEMLRPFLSSDSKWRLPTALSEIDPLYLRLLVAAEDQRFETHPGFDAIAAGRAVWQLLANMRVVSGASTLTMQVARLLEPRPRTLPSKLIEIARALQLEAHFSKDAILRLYATLAPFGGNLEGVRAASLAYFGKEPAHLRLSEAALLVALPQSPERLRPDRFPDAAKAARDRLLDRLTARGAIAAEAAEDAKQEDVPRARLAFPFHAPHLAEQLARGAAPGATVIASVDGPLQVALERLAERERDHAPGGASFAVFAVENASGRVIAHLGSANYWGQHGQIDLTRALRSPGSALKPFVYGLGFDDLPLHPETLIDDEPMVFGDYAPRNFDRGFQGTITIRRALQDSLNVPAVALLDRIGPVRLAASLRHAGAHLAFPRAFDVPSLPMALGGVGISLRDLTMLYTAIPNAGRVKPLQATRDGAAGEGYLLFRPAAAWYLNDILQGSPLPDGWAMGRGIERARRIGFKTGTSYGYRDAWSVGFSGGYTVGVWVGRPDGSTRPGHFGRNEAAPLLLKVFELLPAETPRLVPPPSDVMEVAKADDLPLAMQRFRPPDSTEVSGVARKIEPPRIAFPPDGATVPVDVAAPEIFLSATGGRAPLRWIINGEILPEAALYEQVFYAPHSLGFSRVTVVDAEGRSATSVVRFTRDD